MDRILLMETSEEGKKKYEKKFKCPYCDNRYTRKQLPNHIDNVHHDLIPEGYTALRVAFNAINNKTEGHCVICGAVTAWNEEKGRYERLCGKQSCHDQYVKIAKERMRKKYGTDNMLQDSRYAAEQQKKMLANRKISGEYLFPDGGKVGYVGSYEKNFLHFMDKVMHIESTDIESPAPTIVYQFEGQAHMYIPDFLYVPYNLIIEIKDGGDNPNNRPMEEYRAKIKAKEDAIIKAHKYNYIRLTNNDFSQLMEIFAVLKYTLDENPDQIIVRINESTLLESTNESISKYKRISIDDKSISQYKSDAKYLSHFRIGKDYKGYIWIDGSKVVAATNVNITTKMIQAIEISKEYQGKGLSYSILDIDTKELGATDLSVNKKNATAIHIYKKYGFKIYDEDDTMYYMSLNSKKKNTNESLNESTTLNEAYLRNLPDIYYNKDKFDSGEINFCIITGLSGSGKTTMGRSYQDKKNTQVYELDDLLCIKDHFTMNDLREYGDIIYKFFSGPGKKYYVGDKDGSLDRALKSTLHNHYEDKMFKDFVDYAKQYAKSNKNEKIILEGVWFYVPECGFNPKDYEDSAVYIKGTSMVLSHIRQAKRDASDGDTKVERSLAFIKQILSLKKWGWFLADEKELKVWRDYYSKLAKEQEKENRMNRLINNESMAGTIGAALPQIASPADYKKGKVYIIKPKMQNNVFDYGVTDDYTLGEAVIINKKTDKAEVISCTKLPSTRFDIFEVKSPEKASELWNRAKELVKSQKPAKDSFYEGFTDDQIYYDENYIQVPGFDEELLKESTNIKELILYGTTLDSVEKSVNEFARLTNG